LPLLRNSDRSKISKRKNPVSLTYYRRAGMLPEAIVNFLALMGWSYGEDREIFTLKEMIEVFDLKKISIGGPVFDLVKLTWLNQHYMHKMDEESFVEYIREEIFNKDFLRRLKPLALERMSRFEQFVDNNAFFFNGALDYKHVEVLPASKDKDAVREMLQQLLEQLDELYEWQNKPLHDVLNAHREKIAWKPKDYFMTIRLIVTGRKDSPPLTESMELIGREIVRFRIRNFIDTVLN
jgi:glutamyl-tRNA synthetase